MMFFLVKPVTASALTSGTISGTSGSIRQADELSMTTAPCAAIFGDHSFDTAPPADIRQMSTSEKSKWSSALTFSVLSPNEHSTPWLRREASGDHFVSGEIALGQDVEHLAPDIAGSTDHGDLVTHC